MTPPRPDTPEEPAWGGHPQGPPPPHPTKPDGFAGAPGPPPPPTQTGGYQPYQGYQPFQQYYAPAPAPQRTARQRQGITGAIITALLAVWSFFKYGGLFLLKFGAVKTILTLLLSFGLYAWRLGPLAAGARGLVSR